MKKYPCPCCGYATYPVPVKDDCGYICLVCLWENDPFISLETEPRDSNHGVSLLEARENYKKFGACEKEMLPHVRPPQKDEIKYGGCSSLPARQPSLTSRKVLFFRTCRLRACISFLSVL